MREQTIGLEVAKLAYEKGYNHKSRWYFQYDGTEVLDCSLTGTETPDDQKLWTPTQGLLQKWLREEHKIHCHPFPITDLEKGTEWCFIVDDLSKKIDRKIDSFEEDGYFSTYESALEKGLQEALKLI